MLVAGCLLVAAVALALSAVAKRLDRHGPELAARWRRQPLTRRRTLLAGTAAMAALALLRLLGPAAPPRALTVRFLDVGQGDATLIQSPDGTAVLFDGGPPEAGATRLLRRAGVRQLAMVVATHASRDHHGGLRAVLEQFDVGLLLDGGDGTRDPGFHAVVAEAERRGIRRLPARAPLDLRAGRIRVHVLGPAPRPPGPPPDDPNRRAIVAVVSVGAFDLLLSGDAESDALSSLELPDVDAIKVPHHGSADPGLPLSFGGSGRSWPRSRSAVATRTAIRRRRPWPPSGAPGLRLSHRPSRDRHAHGRGWPPRGRRAPTLDSPQWLS